MTRDLSADELRAALAAADRGMRLPWAQIIIFAGLWTLAIGIALRFIDFADPTHVLIACLAVFMYAQTQFTAGLIATRQNAVNARLLRALELLDERLSTRAEG